jgi:DNA-binding transcriptional MerR regulator
MRIGELARQTATTTKTLRFYEASGLLPEPGRTPGGYRDYAPEAATRVRFITEARSAGFTLRQIGEVLAIRDGGQPPCEHVRTLIALRLDEIEQRLAELAKTRASLRALARRTAEVDPAACDGYCSIIEGGRSPATR